MLGNGLLTSAYTLYVSAIFNMPVYPNIHVIPYMSVAILPLSLKFCGQSSGQTWALANTNELNLFADMGLTCRANFAGSLRHNYGNATYINSVHLGIFVIL